MKLTPVTAGIFMDLELPPREHLLAPWLTTQSLSMLTAYRGVGKTWTALSIAIAVATGGRFLKWHAPSAQPVVYIDGEMAASDLQRRLRLLMQDVPKDWDERLLSIVTPDMQDAHMPDIATELGQDRLWSVVKDAKLIILDNLSCLARSGVENDAESWNSIATWALKMRRQGRSIVFIHHAGKAGQQRGTSKREDLLDVSVMLKRPDKVDDAGASFVWEWSKARGLHGDEADPIAANLRTVNGHVQWLWTPEGDQRLREIVRLDADGLSVREIAAEVGLSKSQISRILQGHRDKADAYRSASHGD